MFCLVREVNFLSIKRDGGDQLGIGNLCSFWIVGEDEEFSLVRDQLNPVLLTVLCGQVQKKVKVDDGGCCQDSVICQGDGGDGNAPESYSKVGVLC